MLKENLHNLNSSVNIIRVKIDRFVARTETMGSEYRILGQGVCKRMLLKWIFKRRVREYELSSADPGLCPVASCCVADDDPSGSAQRSQFLGHVSDEELLKKEPELWS
jgi:hypothetical protein